MPEATGRRQTGLESRVVELGGYLAGLLEGAKASPGLAAIEKACGVNRRNLRNWGRTGKARLGLLKQFCQRLDCPVETLQLPEETEGLLRGSLAGWQPSGSSRLAQWGLVEADVPPGLREHMGPVSVAKGLVEDRTRGFVGRGVIRGRIDEILGSRSNESGYVVISGLPGVGKSALIAWLVKHRGYVHHFNVEQMRMHTPKSFIGSVCAQLIDRYKLPYSKLPVGFEESGQFLGEVLQGVSDRLGESKRAVVAVDALDEVDESSYSPRENPLFLPPSLPRGVYFIVTTRVPLEQLRLNASRLYPLELGHDSEENLNDVRLYVSEKLSDRGVREWMHKKDLGGEGFVELMVEKSDGNFMYLDHVLPAIAAGDFEDFDVQNLPKGLKAYYRCHWEQMRLGDPTFDRLRGRIVCMVAAAERPVSIPELSALADVPREAVIEVLAEWVRRSFVRESQASDDNGRRFHIYHRYFKEFLFEEHREYVREQRKEGVGNLLSELEERSRGR